MKKATHYGTCQICGRRQKLPGGVLAKHGYTTRCGFFMGTCWGAGHLPFEQSKDLIENAIAQASKTAAELAAAADKREASTDAADVVYRGYENWAQFGQRYLKYGYQRIAGRLESRPWKGATGTEYANVWFVAKDFKYEHDLGFYKTADETTKELNKQEAWQIRQTANQAADYAAWQKARIENWQPSELKAVEDE